MLDAGVIGVRAEWNDVDARAKATAFVAWAKAQMASIGSGVPATAGGGMFNRMGGGGNITASGGSPSGGFGGGGFRPFVFDVEADQVRAGLRTLARALYGQAMIVGQLNVAGGGNGGTAALPGGLGNDAGQSLARGFMQRAGRAGGLYAAWRGINYIGTEVNKEMIERQDIDRMLSRNDQEGAVRQQLEEVRAVRASWWRAPLRTAARRLANWQFEKQFGIKGDIQTDEEIEESLQGSLDSFKFKRWDAEIRSHNLQQNRAAKSVVLSGHRAAMFHAGVVTDDAAILAQSYKERADEIADPGERMAMLSKAQSIKTAAAHHAAAIRWKDREVTNTTMLGLTYDIEEEKLRGSFQPRRAQVLGIYADTAMRVREMLINSTPANAQLARQLGIAQEEGYRAQLIMSGRGSVINPFAEAMGPEAGSGIETLTDILKAIQDIADKLSNLSLGDLAGLSENPLDN